MITSRAVGLILAAASSNLVVAGDIVVSGGSLFVEGADVGVAGSIFVENGGQLKLKDAFLYLILDYDEQHHVDVTGDSLLIIDNSEIQSEGGQYWYELYADDQNNSPTMQVSGVDTWLTNHSGIRPFDQTIITVTGGDVEELQVRDQVSVTLSNAAAYPVYFFDGGIPATLSALDTDDAGFTIINDVQWGGWSFSIFNGQIGGYQIDLKNGADVQVADSDGIVLSIHTPGNLGSELQIVEGLTSSGIASGITTNLGSSFTFTDTNVALINLYLFGDDRVLLRDMHVNEVNAEQNSELVVGQKGYNNTRLNCNLCQVYDNAQFSVVNVTVDGWDNVPSATSAFADFEPVGRGIMTFADSIDEPAFSLFLTAREEGVLNLFNSNYDPTKIVVIDPGATVNNSNTGAEFTVRNREGNGSLQADFLDLSGGVTAGYLWDFGDGGTSMQANPSHLYSTPDSYTVSLTVDVGLGSQDTLTKVDYITVN